MVKDAPIRRGAFRSGIRFRKTPRRRRNKRQYKMVKSRVCERSHIKMTTRSSSKICSMEELLRIPPQNPPASGQLSSEGHLLIVTLHDAEWKNNQLQVWDVDGQKKRHEWPTGDAFVDVFAFSPDGALLFGGGDRHNIFCWNLKSGAEVARLENNKYFGRNSLVVSPDGKKLVFMPYDGGIDLFELPIGKKRATMELPSRAAGVAFSPDSKVLAAACGSKIYMFDVTAGKPLVAHPGHSAPVSDAAFSQDGRRLASIEYLQQKDSDRTVIIWDLAARQPISTIRAVDPTTSVAFSGDGRTLVVGRNSTVPWLFKVDENRFMPDEKNRQLLPPLVAAMSSSGALLVGRSRGTLELSGPHFYSEARTASVHFTVYRGHAGIVLGAALSANGSVGASVGTDQKLRIWHAGEINAAAVVPLSGAPAGCVAVSDDGSLVATVAVGRLLVYKSSGGQPILSSDFAGEEPVVLRFAPNAKAIAIGSKEGHLTIRDIPEGPAHRSQQAHSGAINALVFAADGASLFTGGTDGAVTQWKTNNLEKLGEFDKQLGAINCLALSPDGKHLFGADNKQTLVDWNIAAVKRVHVYHPYTSVEVMAVSGDGAEIVTLDQDRTLSRIDVAAQSEKGGGSSLFGLTIGDDDTVAISPDSRLFAKATPAATRVWQVADGKSWRDFPMPAAYENAVTFSHSGKLLAAAGDGLCIWRLDGSAPPLIVPKSQAGQPRAVMFSPDDRLLLSNQWGRDAKLWDANSGELVRPLAMPDGGSSDKIRFSGDGRLLFAKHYSPARRNGTSGPAIAVWEVATGELLGELPLPHPGSVPLSVSPDNRLLAVGLTDGRIWLCDFPAMIRKLSAPPLAGERAEFAAMWERLGAASPAIGYAAIDQLASDPSAVERSAPKLAAIQAQAAIAIAPQPLIDLFSSENPAVVRDASEPVEGEMGAAAHPALRTALEKNPPADVRARLELLLSAQSPPPGADVLRGIRAVQALERLGTPAAVNLLNAALRPDQLSRRSRRKHNRQSSELRAYAITEFLNAPSNRTFHTFLRCRHQCAFGDLRGGTAAVARVAAAADGVARALHWPKRKRRRLQHVTWQGDVRLPGLVHGQGRWLWDGRRALGRCEPQSAELHRRLLAGRERTGRR